MSTESYTTNQDYIILLCQRLKEYRLAARISQKEMAEKSGVSLTTISHLEQGVNQNITLNNFISLLRAVGMEQRLNDLLPELPMPPMALKQINKYIPKRVRRNSHDTESWCLSVESESRFFGHLQGTVFGEDMFLLRPKFLCQRLWHCSIAGGVSWTVSRLLDK